jgi:hypothetical protein
MPWKSWGAVDTREPTRAIRADPSLESLPILVQTSDASAVRAPVWGPLRVAHVMDKLAFGQWFEKQIHDLPEWRGSPQRT